MALLSTSRLVEPAVARGVRDMAGHRVRDPAPTRERPPREEGMAITRQTRHGRRARACPRAPSPPRIEDQALLIPATARGWPLGEIVWTALGPVPVDALSHRAVVEADGLRFLDIYSIEVAILEAHPTAEDVSHGPLAPCRWRAEKETTDEALRFSAGRMTSTCSNHAVPVSSEARSSTPSRNRPAPRSSETTVERRSEAPGTGPDRTRSASLRAVGPNSRWGASTCSRHVSRNSRRTSSYSSSCVSDAARKAPASSSVSACCSRSHVSARSRCSA